jgi:G:T/U-mismatch repair DNA glycosylase
LQKVRNWFKNHHRQVAEDEDDEGEGADKCLMTTWTVRKVVKEMMNDEIDAKIKEEDPNVVAGSAGYIQLYQYCWSQVEKGLSDAERLKLDKLAAKWNREGTNHVVQARCVVSNL